MDRTPQHVSCHETLKPRAPVAQYPILYVCVVSALLDQCAQCLQTNSGSSPVFRVNLTIIGWILYLQWVYARSKPDMFSRSTAHEYSESVRFRFLMIPIIATLTMLVCFWSFEITLAVYALLMPFYMIPGKSERHPPRNPEPTAQESHTHPQL